MLKFTTLGCLFVLLLVGCATVRPVDPRVTVIDSVLEGNILISNVVSVPNKGGFLEVQVTGENQTRFYKNLEYKIEWLDRNGFAIPTILSRWTSFPAYKRSDFRFKAVAPKTAAADFRILIRQGD